MKRRNPGTSARATSTTPIADTSIVASQQVSWWAVHEHVAPVLEQVESWPMVGTPEWCALPGGDPVKLAALFDAARHHVLRIETAQAALCEASRDVSAAEDWSAIAKEIRQRREVYIPRRAS